MKSTSEILALLKAFKTTAFEKYGFTRLGIFGSTARGEQTENSDVDIYYEGKAPSLLTLDRIQQELEELLGCSVDLVRIRENMNATLKKQIQNEGIYVWHRNGYSQSSQYQKVLELIIERRANVASADDFLHSSDGMMHLDAICMNLIAIGEDIPLMLPVINKILNDLEKQIV